MEIPRVIKGFLENTFRDSLKNSSIIFVRFLEELLENPRMSIKENPVGISEDIPRHISDGTAKAIKNNPLRNVYRNQ